MPNDAISLTSSVTIPDGVLFRDLLGEAVILNLNTGVYFGLDPVGTRVWHLLQERRTVQQILEVLLAEYEVTEARCRADLLTLLAQMQAKGLIEVSNATPS